MKYLLLTVLILIAPSISNAGFWNSSENLEGVAYLAKVDGTKVYEHAEGEAVAVAVNKNFPFVAFAGDNKWLGIMASESIVNGRAHVRYWKNGQNEKDGENTAWVDLKEVERIQFNCCGDNANCSGITTSLFKTRTYTDCYIKSMQASINQSTATTSKGAVEFDKLKLQLEIEKLKIQKEIEQLKLEQVRIKAGVKSQASDGM
ncbi:MAG: hypothetical protein EG822_05760 [Deltaproteobacteria bacterium]|nr:hypothetical protein [Deltaproteobacteria bacterium]TLN04602.1 MAG: hypothetical protein FDZ73_02400 [bacterium]